MKKFRFAMSIAVLFAALSISGFAKTRAELVRDAVSENESSRTEAIAELRALGQDGLDALFGEYGAGIADFAAGRQTVDNWPRIAAAIDSVAMQKDAYASRLYWFTDLDRALAEAKTRNRPVLSLRLLGNLNEEFSCANSRFFRAILYSNSGLSRYLRENYVLHWRSVRPVPKVTIDFGDGRKLERTLAGNSIHYILSSNGELIDALAGLNDPATFDRYLKRASTMSATLASLAPSRRAAELSTFRGTLFDEIRARRQRIVTETKVKLEEAEPSSNRPLEIAPLAVTKARVEAPILRDLDDNFSRFEPQIATRDWLKLAAANIPDVTIDAASLAFIKRQNPTIDAVGFDRMIANLRSLVAVDTTRNEFLFHLQLFGRMNRAALRPDLESFNSSVYSEMFRTPEADKWLGLYTDDVYIGLNGNGIR